MEGKTHRLGGTVCAMAGFLTLKDSGYLIQSDFNFSYVTVLSNLHCRDLWGYVAR